jgi:hypothetical protein
MSATAWYIARSSGIVAYLLLSSSVVLGALMAGRGLATPHGFLAGTDRFDPWFAGIAAGTVSAVAMVLGTRFSQRRLAT